jgi:3-hydroxymyristoyl/3-hydroxydecanoyl-(acyl carrier protein) dehydratase
LKKPYVDFSDFSFDKLAVDREGILAVNPHRFELRLLDGILQISDETAVGYKDLKDDEFWIRGHFPGRPLMPGVLICECAAQLSSYFAITTKMVDNGYVGLGGLESIRFRGPVVPGDKLVVMLKRGKVRRNAMFTADFQGWVDETMVVDGTIKGVALGS